MGVFKKWLEMALGNVIYDIPDSKALNSKKYNDKFVEVLKRHPDFTFNFIIFLIKFIIILVTANLFKSTASDNGESPN